MGSLSYPDLPNLRMRNESQRKGKIKYGAVARTQTQIPTKLLNFSRAILYTSLSLLFGEGRGRKWQGWWQSSTRTTLLSLCSILLPSPISMALDSTPLSRFLSLPPISLQVDAWFDHELLINMKFSLLGIAKNGFFCTLDYDFTSQHVPSSVRFSTNLYWVSLPSRMRNYGITKAEDFTTARLSYLAYVHL